MALIKFKKLPKNVRKLKVVGGYRAETKLLLEATVCTQAPKPAHVLLEAHEKPCGCSYCKGTRPGWRWVLDLRLPEDKGHTSWRVLALKLPHHMLYLRWTLIRWKPLPVPEETKPAEPEIRVHRFEVN